MCLKRQSRTAETLGRIDSFWTCISAWGLQAHNRRCNHLATTRRSRNQFVVTRTVCETETPALPVIWVQTRRLSKCYVHQNCPYIFIKLSFGLSRMGQVLLCLPEIFVFMGYGT